MIKSVTKTKLILTVLFVFLLTGCIGEEYDFSPPAFLISSTDNIGKEQQLIESNINWNYDKTFNKETKDIFSLAKEQNKIYFNSGQELQFYLDGGIFDAKKVEISLWKDEKRIDLDINNANQYFNLPEEIGEYIMVVELPGFHGDVQYVGNIVIQ